VFVDLGIQHAMRMRCFIMSPVVCPAVQYFSTLSQNGTFFRKKLLYIKYVL